MNSSAQMFGLGLDSGSALSLRFGVGLKSVCHSIRHCSSSLAWRHGFLTRRCPLARAAGRGRGCCLLSFSLPLQGLLSSLFSLPLQGPLSFFSLSLSLFTSLAGARCSLLTPLAGAAVSSPSSFTRTGTTGCTVWSRGSSTVWSGRLGSPSGCV